MQSWGYAGGSVELDEKVEDAAKRELLEETGLLAVSLDFFGIFSGPDMHYVYPNGDEVSNIDIVFICKDYTGELKEQPSEVVRRCKPKCAICAYHQSSDLWEIPIYLKKLVPEYKIYFRHHDYIHTDIICYALV